MELLADEDKADEELGHGLLEDDGADDDPELE
jgi:hypothetical protein